MTFYYSKNYYNLMLGWLRSAYPDSHSQPKKFKLSHFQLPFHFGIHFSGSTLGDPLAPGPTFGDPLFELFWDPLLRIHLEALGSTFGDPLWDPLISWDPLLGSTSGSTNFLGSTFEDPLWDPLMLLDPLCQNHQLKIFGRPRLGAHIVVEVG